LLAGSGVSGALQDPTLQLSGEKGSVAFNDNWQQNQEAAIKATGIPPSRAAEAAIVRTLAPGNYTAVVRGKNDSVGVGLVEVYDLAQGAQSELANISSRGFVDTGENVLIGGFIVSGNARVVVRALGPSLADQGVAGVLADPALALVNANGMTVRANDNWKSGQPAELTAIGIAPTRDKEAALVQALAAGSYTAIVRGVNNSTGVGLVEVYNIQ